MQALNIQGSLASATDGMNVAMKRMSTGFKINQASDDAAGMAVSTNMETQISGASVAYQNAQIGSNLLSTAEGTLNVVQKNVQRIRDLVEQSANGSSSQEAKTAARTEIIQRRDEINRQTSGTTFNKVSLFSASGAGVNGIDLQVGSGKDYATNVINLNSSVFAAADLSSLGITTAAINLVLGDANGANASAAGSALQGSITALLGQADTALTNVSNRKTTIGALQNRLSSAMEGLTVQKTNLTAANSTIKDADIAEESASYVKNQILQSASASLLSQANSQPQIALKLIG